MKKRLFSMVVVALFVLIPAATMAAATASLDGKDYKVVIFCMNSIEDYCDQYVPYQDSFKFDGGFELGSMDDTFFGYGSDGNFDDNGFSFSADLEVYEEDLARYNFDISGYNLLDELIFGTMDIEYSEWDIFSWDKKDDTTAYFAGWPR